MYKFAYIITFIFIRIMFPCKIIGKENYKKNSAAILVCNHLSNLDPVYCFSYIHEKNYILAKKQMFKNKLFGWFFKKIGAIPVDRENGNNIGLIKQCLMLLKNKQKLVVFPEGTRNKQDTNLQSIKSGTGVIATKAKVPIIPMYITKRGKIFKKNTLIIGKPFELSQFYNIKLDENDIHEINNIIITKMNELREH